MRFSPWVVGSVLVLALGAGCAFVVYRDLGFIDRVCGTSSYRTPDAVDAARLAQPSRIVWSLCDTEQRLALIEAYAAHADLHGPDAAERTAALRRMAAELLPAAGPEAISAVLRGLRQQGRAEASLTGPFVEQGLADWRDDRVDEHRSAYAHLAVQFVQARIDEGVAHPETCAAQTERVRAMITAMPKWNDAAVQPIWTYAVGLEANHQTDAAMAWIDAMAPCVGEGSESDYQLLVHQARMHFFRATRQHVAAELDPAEQAARRAMRIGELHPKIPAIYADAAEIAVGVQVQRLRAGSAVPDQQLVEALACLDRAMAERVATQQYGKRTVPIFVMRAELYIGLKRFDRAEAEFHQALRDLAVYGRDDQRSRAAIEQRLAEMKQTAKALADDRLREEFRKATQPELKQVY